MKLNNKVDNINLFITYNLGPSEVLEYYIDELNWILVCVHQKLSSKFIQKHINEFKKYKQDILKY